MFKAFCYAGQARERSARRLREGRPKPIDLVAHNLAASGDADIEVPEPYEVFGGLTLVDVRELHEDISMFQVQFPTTDVRTGLSMHQVE